MSSKGPHLYIVSHTQTSHTAISRIKIELSKGGWKRKSPCRTRVNCKPRVFMLEVEKQFRLQIISADIQLDLFV